MFELVLQADEALVEPLTEALIDELGALSAAVEDADASAPQEQPLFGEPGLPAPRAAWCRSRVTALFDNEAAAQAAAALLVAQHGADGLQLEALRPVADQDWVRLTQSQFEPVAITDSFWIVPTWHAVPAAAQRAIRLDPGLAFGTGTHPTTALCLEWLEQANIAGCDLLDYGCGSGILAIAALRLGAATACGLDIDPQALTASRDNALRNGVADRLTLLGPGEAPPGNRDIVLANILAGPLTALAPLLQSLVKPQGRIVLSGILVTQAAAVAAAYAPWFDIFPATVRGEWVRLDGMRHPAAVA